MLLKLDKRTYSKLSILLVIYSVMAFGNGPNDMKPTAIERLQAQGIDTSAYSLATVLQNGSLDTETRYYAALALGASGDSSALSILTAALADQNSDIRGGAIIGLRSLGNSSADTALIGVLFSDEEPVIRQVSITALEVAASPRAVAAIVEAASDTSMTQGTRSNALMAIERIANRELLVYESVRLRLELLLDDPDLEIRSVAALSIAAHSDERAIPVLVAAALAPETSSWLRSRSIRRLEKSVGKNFGYFKTNDRRSTQSERDSAIQHIREWWKEFDQAGN